MGISGGLAADLAEMMVHRGGIADRHDQRRRLARRRADRTKPRSLGMPATTAASVVDALCEFGSRAASPARILICGSLHFAGTVLAANG